MLLEAQWVTGDADFGQNFYERPVFSEATNLFDGLFYTDTPGIQGYKRLIEMKAVSETGTQLTVRYLLIAYRDRQTKIWKVLSAFTGDRVNVESQVSQFGQNLKDTRMNSGQFNYLNYGQWLLLAGKIKEARQALNAALSAGTTSTMLILGKTFGDDGRNSEYFRLKTQTLLSVIASVTGENPEAIKHPDLKTP
jgi:hypothetical protein